MAAAPFDCQPGCGACCIAPAISSPLPGLPNGKPAGQRCPHLDTSLRCELFGRPERPAVCQSFRADASLCGQGPAHAMAVLHQWETETRPVRLCD